MNNLVKILQMIKEESNKIDLNQFISKDIHTQKLEKSAAMGYIKGLKSAVKIIEAHFIY